MDVPDKNLAAAVRKHLGLAASTPITQEALEALVEFGADDEPVKDITGLQHATSLVKLWFWGPSNQRSLTPCPPNAIMAAISQGQSDYRYNAACGANTTHTSKSRGQSNS